MRTSHSVRCLLAVAVASSCVYACGDDEARAPVQSSSTAGRGGRRDAGDPFKDAGPERDAGGGGSGGSKAPSNAAAPVVEILEPAEAGDPNGDGVLIEEIVRVRCRVTKSKVAGARPVDLAKVRIQRINPEDPTHPIMGTVTAQPDDVFEAEFRLSDVPNGPLAFTCEADDMGNPALTGRATVDTFLDLGPNIELIRPADGSAHRLQGNVQVSFRVSEAPLAASDDEATPTAIKLTVSGVPFEFTESRDDPGLYSAAINFDNRMQFPMPPTTAEIVVTAQSSRTPEAPTRRVKSDITIDSEGPTIKVTMPTDGKIVRSDVTLQVTITDTSGIDQDTVIGTIALPGDDYVLSDWSVVGTTYTETFDTRSFDPTLTQLTINIVAQDLVGNLSTPATLVIRIDNVAPVVSLDPPKVREYTMAGTNKFCSEPFDPVGDDAASDLDVVSPTAMYRVMVHERTNYAPGQNFGYIAGVDMATMQLFARRMPATGEPEPPVPLLIDTDGDANHVCDDINFEALPIASRPLALDLAPVTPRGTSLYLTTFNPSDPVNIADSDCMTPMANNMPPLLCPSSPMIRIISQQIEGPPPPAIYGRLPTNANLGECSGQQWQLPFDEGWVCIAARVKDAIGNVGLSRPIRVCFDDGNGTPRCDPNTDTPPTCTGMASVTQAGCTWPIDFAANQTLLAR